MRKDIIFETLLILAITALFVLSIIYRTSLEAWATKEVSVYGMLMVFLISFFLELLPQYITPHIFLIEAKILNIEIVPMLGVLIMATLFGSIAGFEIGRKYGTKIVDKFYRKEEHKLKKLSRKHGKWLVAIAAVSPLPYIPLVFGSIGIKRNEFYTYGILTRIAGLIILALFVSLF